MQVSGQPAVNGYSNLVIESGHRDAGLRVGRRRLPHQRSGLQVSLIPGHNLTRIIGDLITTALGCWLNHVFNTFQRRFEPSGRARNMRQPQSLHVSRAVGNDWVARALRQARRPYIGGNVTIAAARKQTIIFGTYKVQVRLHLDDKSSGL
jgi:hypothetical protein